MAFATGAWLLSSFKTVSAQKSSPNRLIVILLRGGVDGLNLLAPYSDSHYYEARPRLAIAPPGEANGLLSLTQDFGLHPALKSLIPLWRKQTLSFIPACGSPDPTRSHFDAQDYLENGTPGQKNTGDGWLNRLLGQLENSNPVQALNIGNTTPRILLGPQSVASLAHGEQATQPLAIDQSINTDLFDRLYQNSTMIGRVYQESRMARQTLLANLAEEMEAANQGAPLPKKFVGDAQRLAQIMRKNPQVQLAFTSLGGWDTHIKQGNHLGRLANLFQSLGKGLATLSDNLGEVYDQTVIVVLSEFGRAVRENGSGGTDHGHGNVMLLMGGALNGGKILGEWRGLESSELYQARDLPVLTDFRDPLISIFQQHFKLSSDQMASIFPNYQASVDFSLV